MIILCISGSLLSLIGIIVVVPKIKYIIVCKKSVVGVIVDVLVDNASESRPVKVSFSYNVDGKEFKNHTQWTSFGSYKIGSRKTVKYNEKKPQESYLCGDGIILRMMVGVLFFVVGIFFVFSGCILKI